MSIRVAELFADLTLRASDFQRGLQNVVRSTEQAGNEMSRAFTGPQQALNQMVQTAQRAGQNISRATTQSVAGATNAVNGAAQATNGLAGSFNNASGAVRRSSAEIERTLNQRVRRTISDVEHDVARLTWNTRGYIKDTARVITGIVISQAFYKILNTIEEAVTSVVKFGNEVEQAGVAFEILLGNAQRAQAFIGALEDFAAKTPFSLQSARDASQRLLAMGFAANQVIPTMRILSDATAVFGANSQQLDRIVLALGQMKTNGFIAGQELRQLAEAGIPAYQILREELGLTTEQLQKIGKLKISGDVGVDAILKGMEKRYKGAADKISKTLGGLVSTIKDDLLIISNSVFAGGYERLKTMATNTVNSLEIMREALKKGGLKGLFETLVPPTMRVTILTLMATFKQLAATVGILYSAFQPLVVVAGEYVARALAAILPPLVGVAQGIARLLAWATSSSPILKGLFTAIISLTIASYAANAITRLALATRLLSIASAVAAAVRSLGAAITFVYAAATRNPIVALVTLIAAAILGIAMSSEQASKWMDSLMQRIDKFFGIKAENFPNPVGNDEFVKAMDAYNQQLQLAKKDMTGVGKEAEKTGKKVKDSFIASFDEVYQIPDNLDGAGDALDDMPIPNYPDFKIPDVKAPDPGTDPGKSIEDQLKDRPPIILPIDIKFNWPQSPLPPGTAVVTQAMETINEAIARLKQAAAVPVQILVNVVDGATAVLERVATKATELGGKLATVTVSVIDQASTVISGILTELGKLADKAITVTVTVAIPVLADAFQEAYNAIVNFATVTVPAAFNQLTTWLSENWKPILIGVLVAIVAVVAFVFGGEIVAAVGAAIAAIGAALTAFGSWVAGVLGGSTVLAGATGAISAGFATAMAAIMAALAIAGTALYAFWDDIVVFFSDMTDTVSTWATETASSISTWVTDTATDIGTWVTDRVTDFTTWATDTKTQVTTWATDTASSISTWVTDTAKDVTKWASDTLKSFTSWGKDVLKTVGDKFGEMGNAIVKFFRDDIPKWINDHKQGILTTLGIALAALVVAIVAAVAGVPAAIATGLAAIVLSVVKVFDTDIVNGVQTAFGKIPSKLLAIKDSLVSTAQTVASSVTSVFDNAISGVKTAIANIGSSIGTMTASVATRVGVPGFATGGIIEKEQIVRVAEGGKREGIIPLSGAAMRPFAQAVASELGLTGGSGGGTNSQQQILYVGTLIADDRSLKELERKMTVIRINENQRKGVTG